jgi:hypothetical protein
MKRIQLELPEKTVEDLKVLMEETGTETYKELISNALTLLDWCVQQVQEGRIIAAVDESNMKYKQIVMPVLRNATAKRKEPERKEPERKEAERKELVNA